jgi:hypothetical protein
VSRILLISESEVTPWLDANPPKGVASDTDLSSILESTLLEWSMHLSPVSNAMECEYSMDEAQSAKRKLAEFDGALPSDFSPSTTANKKPKLFGQDLALRDALKQNEGEVSPRYD